MEGKIKNQPFTLCTIPNPNSTSSYDTYRNIEYYYNISYGGHIGGEWRKLFGTEDDAYIKQSTDKNTHPSTSAIKATKSTFEYRQSSAMKHGDSPEPGLTVS